MTKLQLDLACGDYDRTRALQDGRVQPEGIELTYITVKHPRELFWRMLRHQEFDVAEMSLASYIARLAQGNCPFVAIPAFVSRAFRHAAAYVYNDSGIQQPADLKGKRVGVPEYQMTALVWLRGILQDEYGVKPSDIHWYAASRERAPLSLPSDVRVERVTDGRSLSQMLETGELDAVFSARAPEAFVRRSPKLRRLFPDYRKAEIDYFRRTGIFPIMHLIVVRKELYERHPWIAQSLYKAFCEAKQLCAESIYQTGALPYMLPWLVNEIETTRELMGHDFWSYGLEPNRTVLETFLRYLNEQGIIDRQLSLEELFTQETYDAFQR